MPQEKHSDNDLCPAGKVLEVRLHESTKSLIKASKSLEASSIRIEESIKQLTGFAIRDNERIEFLEKSRDCKSKKLNLIEADVQGIDRDFATHLGEHKAERRLTVASGIGGAGGLLGMWELFKFLVKGS